MPAKTRSSTKRVRAQDEEEAVANLPANKKIKKVRHKDVARHEGAEKAAAAAPAKVKTGVSKKQKKTLKKAETGEKPKANEKKRKRVDESDGEDEEENRRTSRKVPVTRVPQPVLDESEDEDGASWGEKDGNVEPEDGMVDEFDLVEADAEAEDSDDGEVDEADGMNVEGLDDTQLRGKKATTANESKGEHSHPSHAEQKAALAARRASKPYASLLTEAKAIWCTARERATPRDQRADACARLLALVRGKVKELARRHDAARLLQTVVKHGRKEEREEVAKELKGMFREMVQSRYAKFLIAKLIRTCSPRVRGAILSELRGLEGAKGGGAAVRLLLHREAGSVLADAYELYANAVQRALLVHDFYGREVALFDRAGDAHVRRKGKSVGASTDQGLLGDEERLDEELRVRLRKGLAGVLEDADLERKRRVLGAVKENVDLVLNNPEKAAVSYAFFHHVLWEYIEQVNALSDEALQEKLRRELFEGCQEILAEMVHTKDGSRLVREFIAQGTAKDRKQIVKVLKPHVERICKDDEAQLVLFTALDVIDDTKLTAKSLVSEMTSQAPTLIQSARGRRALLYLLVPRVPRHFTPALVSLLKMTDEARARTSKKDASARENEVRVAASGPLIEMIEEEKTIDEMLRDPGGSLLVVEIMLYAIGDKSKVISTLIRPVSQPYPSQTQTATAGKEEEGKQKPHVIDVPHACRVYKTLLQGGHFSHHTKAVERAPAETFSPSQLATAWLTGSDPGASSGVGRETTRAIGLGGGAFVLAALVDRVVEDNLEEQRKLLCEWLDEEWKEELEGKNELRGKTILLDALKRL